MGTQKSMTGKKVRDGFLEEVIVDQKAVFIFIFINIFMKKIEKEAVILNGESNF